MIPDKDLKIQNMFDIMFENLGNYNSIDIRKNKNHTQLEQFPVLKLGNPISFSPQLPKKAIQQKLPFEWKKPVNDVANCEMCN